MISFDWLNLHMVLIFKLRDLHVLDVFDVGYLLFEFFDFVEKATIFKIAWGWSVDGDSVMFAFPHFDFGLFLVDEFSQFFVFWEELSVMLEDEIDFFLQVDNFFAFVFEHSEFFDKAVILSFEGAD